MNSLIQLTCVLFALAASEQPLDDPHASSNQRPARIGVVAESHFLESAQDPDSTENSAWKNLEEHLNLGLEHDGFSVEFVEFTNNRELYRAFTEERVDAAILTPFHYILADLESKDIAVLARIRRSTSLTLKNGDPAATEAPSQILSAREVPRAEYRSLLVGPRGIKLHRKQGEHLTVGLGMPTSLTTFVIPYSLIATETRLEGKLLRAAGTITDSDKQIWNVLAESQDPDGESSTESLKRMLNSTGGNALDLVAISDSKYELMFDQPTREKQLRKVWSSSPIPFDPVVASTKPGQPLESVQAREALARAFVSTSVLGATERNNIFSWKSLNNNDPQGDSRSWRRTPNIYDFIRATPDDYDVVRRLAVQASGGEVIRLGISEWVHSDGDDEFFSKARRRLLAEATTDNDASPMFLDTVFYTKDRTHAMIDAYRSGDLHLAELPFRSALRLLGTDSRHYGTAVFDDSWGISPGSNASVIHKFLIVGLKPEVRSGSSGSKFEISSEDRFAYTTRESSAGFDFPIRELEKRGVYLSEEQKIQAGDAVGVMLAVKNKEVEWGFVPDYDFRRIAKDELFGPDLADFVFYKDGDMDVEVPNALLIGRATTNASGSSLRIGAGGWLANVAASFGPSTGQRTTTSQPSSSAIDSAVSALVDPKIWNERKFRGYQEISNSNTRDQLIEIYRKDNPSPILPLFLASTLVVVGFGVLIWKKSKTVAADGESTERSKPASLDEELSAGLGNLGAIAEAAVLLRSWLLDPDRKQQLAGIYQGKFLDYCSQLDLLTLDSVHAHRRASTAQTDEATRVQQSADLELYRLMVNDVFPPLRAVQVGGTSVESKIPWPTAPPSRKQAQDGTQSTDMSTLTGEVLRTVQAVLQFLK